jgi:RNA polymerase sigma factor (sigma-70 family)
MTDDSALLRDYAATRSESAFATLVERHLDLVYFTALRRCGGDAHSAQDVTQQVFTSLARQAASLFSHTLLGGWLYVTTRNLAAKHMRVEQARRMREAKALHMDEVLNTSRSLHPAERSADWEQLRPVLDDVIDQLNERERDAVLLRFFENRAFAEIGTMLRTTEDAARMRVERALDKLRVLLERRGIQSTGAALAAALSEPAAFAKPAGLAANVTTSALAGAAATAAGGMAAFGLMSTAKFSAGTVALGLAFCASLTGNAWMLFRSPSAEAPTPAMPARPAVAASPAPAVPADLVKSADLASLRDQMRNAGAGDTAIRAALEGILRRRYREQLSADIIARLRRGWWRDHVRTWGTANDTQLPFPDLWLMQRMISEPLEQLLGSDRDTVEAAEVRYAFLPAELRQEFGRLDRAGVGGWSRSGQPEIDDVTEAEVERRRAAVADRRKELLASLTSTQRDEYEMRFGQFAAGLARQFQSITVTEQEFRAVFPIAQAYANSVAAQPRQPDNSVRAALDAETASRLVSALGYERALDYIWATAPEYTAVARLARDASLPPTTAGKIVQLAAETTEAAISIHERADLSIEGKRAALVALQGKARAQVDGLLPADAQQRAAPHAFAWLNELGEGRYKTIWTALPGLVRVIGGGGTQSIAEPRPGSAGRQLVPRRPGGN